MDSFDLSFQTKNGIIAFNFWSGWSSMDSLAWFFRISFYFFSFFFVCQNYWNSFNLGSKPNGSASMVFFILSLQNYRISIESIEKRRLNDFDKLEHCKKRKQLNWITGLWTKYLVWTFQFDKTTTPFDITYSISFVVHSYAL